MNQADAAHHRRLFAEVDGLAADIDIGIAERLSAPEESTGRSRSSLCWSMRDIVGLGLAAPAGDVDDAGYGLEATLQYPVLEGLQSR